VANDTVLIANPTQAAITVNAQTVNAGQVKSLVVADTTTDLYNFVAQGCTVATGSKANGTGGIGLAGSLSALLGTGAPIVALPVNALVQPIVAGEAITLNDGAGHTQVFVTTAAVAQGAVSIPVASQTPNFAYPANTTKVEQPSLDNVTTIVQKGARMLQAMARSVFSAGADAFAQKGL
jgi:hypothetical protein